MWFLNFYPSDFNFGQPVNSVKDYNKMTNINEVNEILDSIQLELPLFEEQKSESARPTDQETDKSGGSSYFEAQYTDGKDSWFELQR